jgi:predicted nucleotidyltransferase
VQTWEAFDAFKGAIVNGGDFVGDAAILHRIYTVPERLGLRMPVDIVPFGPLEAPAGAIHWPPKGDTIMDVRGFQMGLNSALEVEVEPGLIVRMPRAETMVLMKALAWKDRGATTHGRDAIDLVELLERGEDLIGLDILYEDHLDVVERHGGDPRLAGAEVLGMRARQGLPEELGVEIVGILAQGLNANFVVQVLSGRAGSGGAERYVAVEALVRAFLFGLGTRQG